MLFLSVHSNYKPVPSLTKRIEALLAPMLVVPAEGEYQGEQGKRLLAGHRLLYIEYRYKLGEEESLYALLNDRIKDAMAEYSMILNQLKIANRIHVESEYIPGELKAALKELNENDIPEPFRSGLVGALELAEDARHLLSYVRAGRVKKQEEIARALGKDAEAAKSNTHDRGNAGGIPPLRHNSDKPEAP